MINKRGWGMGHWGASAVVRQSGLGGSPHEELPKGFPDLRRLASLGKVKIPPFPFPFGDRYHK
ncbi:hypothetical protein A6S26_26550 [Nostoc sp. ATCC 43529]|nr:hypothetical protein A6S26_26550 [Nostoc sp. ATCC 43529]